MCAAGEHVEPRSWRDGWECAGSRRLLLGEQQTGGRSAREVGLHRIDQEFKHAFAVLSTGRDRGPNSFQPTTTWFTATALRDSPVDHHKANRLLRQVIRRFHAGRHNELKILDPV